jgi:hypothetical protein
MTLDGRPGARLPYYVENFERILDTVLDRYSDLLDAAERAFADDLRALGIEARSLYVRLVSRVGPCFRRDHLRYDEVPELDRAIDELAAAGFLDTSPGTEPAHLLPYLHRAELEALGARFGVSVPRSTKARWVERLLSACQPGALYGALRERAPLVAPLGLDHVALYRLLFFGNLRQDWTELLLADLGVWRYESYPLRRDLRLFATRSAIDDALAIRGLAAAASERLAAGDEAGARSIGGLVARREPRWDAAASGLVDEVLLTIAAHFERAGDFDQALTLYGAAASPPARERRARLLARTGRERRALALCRDIAASPRDENERQFATRFEQRLRRRLGQVPPFWRRYRTARRLALPPDPRRPVEELALEHLASAGHDGFHAENWLWLVLYGLAFWDVMFAPVAGAFQHAFQSGPLDLGEPSFRARREGSVAARLAEVEAGDWPLQRLLAVWEAKRGIRNRLVSWSPTVPARLELALSRLHGRHLAAVLDRLSRDLGRYGRGLPDLFVTAPGEPGFELLEVKGPGDRLRAEQIGWLDYLADNGVPSTVLTVEWSTGAGGAIRD